MEFEDQQISPDGLIYTARYAAGPNRGREIPHGEKIKLFANPFEDGSAFVMDARGVYQGQLPLYKKACAINPDAFFTDAPFESRPQIKSADLIAAAREKHERNAATLEPDRINMREAVQDARDMRTHNKRVLNGDPVTPEEIREHRTDARRHTSAVAMGRALARTTPAAPAHDPCADDADDWTAPSHTTNPAPQPTTDIETW